MAKVPVKRIKRAGPRVEGGPKIVIKLDLSCPWARRGDKYAWSRNDRMFAMELLAEHIEWWCCRRFPHVETKVVLDSKTAISVLNMTIEEAGVVHNEIGAMEKVGINLVARNVNALKRSPVFMPRRYVWAPKSKIIHIADRQRLFMKTRCGRVVLSSRWRSMRVWDVIQDRYPKHKLCQRCVLKSVEEDVYLKGGE